MAIWEIPESQIIDYSPNGDDVDSFSQKTKFCLEELFKSLQHLHSNGATAGLDDSDTTPWEIRVNTVDGCIYIRNGENTEWILLGEVATYYGITPEKIHAVRNGDDAGQLLLGRLLFGKAERKPTTAGTNDFYFESDTNVLYRWDGTNWVIFLSRNFGDILNYEKYCIARSELTTIGGVENKNKILQLDENGNANVDITGSPARIADYEIDFQDLRDGHAIVFNDEKKKFVNLPNQVSPSWYNEVMRLANEVAHLKRLAANLYAALKESELNPGGADGIITDCFSIGKLTDFHIDRGRSALLPANGFITSAAADVVSGGYIVTTDMSIAYDSEKNDCKPVTCDVIITHSKTVADHENFGVLDGEVAVRVTEETAPNTPYWLADGAKVDTESFQKLTKIGTYPDRQSNLYITHLHAKLFKAPLPDKLNNPRAYFRLHFKQAAEGSEYKIYSIRYIFNE